MKNSHAHATEPTSTAEHEATLIPAGDLQSGGAESQASALTISLELPRHERIAAKAYQLAEKRGFQPGGELDDWLQAESEVDAMGQAVA
jgi:hypothetical protein